MTGAVPAAAIQSVATLRYFLLDGHARLEPLRVFGSRRVRWGDRVVTLYVLGTSHAVLVEQGDLALTELLTCATGDLDARVLEHRNASSEWSVVRTIDTLQYDCRLSLFPLERTDRLRGAFSRADQLAFHYGSKYGTEAPLTRIGWRVDNATLLVETVHTYPQDGCGVRSESRFEVLAAEAAAVAPAGGGPLRA